MSGAASTAPSGAVNGPSPSKPSPGTPNGAPPGYRPRARRPPPPANPLAANKYTRRAAPTKPGVNGAAGSNAPGQQAQRQAPSVASEEYEEIPIYTTKRSLVAGMRHHVLRFVPAASSKEQVVDIYDSAQFERPIRLHRRDPRINPLGHLEDSQDGGDQPNATSKAVDDKEREKQEALKAERRAEREKDQALIAPTNKSQKPRNDKPRKDQNFVQSFSDNSNKQKNMAIRYEEKLPWHFEDFENKQTWWGAYENPMSEIHVALIESQDQNGRPTYQMLPLQRFYKFHRKNQHKTLSWQTAMAAMNKGAPDPYVVQKARVNQDREKRRDSERVANKALFAVKSERGEQGASGGMKMEDDDQREMAIDVDDIDFNAEEDFADDEEGPAPIGKEEEEETKEVNQRMKKEQLEANIFEFKEQKDWDKEEEVEREKYKSHRKSRKNMRRALQEHEKNFDFDEESEDGDLSDESSNDSEIERIKADEKRQEEERKAAEGKGGKDKVASGASGASSARAGTPYPLRPTKPDDPRRKVLKRAGSPSLSDASGNESASRKKLKQKHGPSALAANGNTASRPGSPAYSATNGGPEVVAPAPLRPGVKMNLDSPTRQSSPTRAGSGSDVEMSDGGTSRHKKKKASGNNSPRESRPGSPEGTQTTDKAAPPSLHDAETIKACIPANGVSMNAFVTLPKIKTLRTRDPKAFTSLLKAHANFDATTKMLYPKGQSTK